MKAIWIKIKKAFIGNISLIILVSFAALFLVLWIVSASELRIADLFLNLLACFVASAITAGVVERIMKKNEEKRIIPIRQAIYRDVQLYTVRIVDLWQEMYVQSQADRSEIPIEQLFSLETMNKIFSSLDLDGEPNVLPKRTWFTHIEDYSNEMKKRAEEILDRYSSYLSPDFMQVIHYSLTDCVFSCGGLKMISGLYAMDKRNSIPRPTILSFYLVAPQEKDYEQIQNLLKWCRKEYTLLSKKGVIVYPLPEKVTILNPHTPPSSIMGEEKLTQFYQDYEAWSKSNPSLK